MVEKHKTLFENPKQFVNSYLEGHQFFLFFLLLFIAKSRQLRKEDESRRSEHANNSKIRINDADSIVVELPENVKK